MNTPHPAIAALPLIMLIAFQAVVIALFGSDALAGGSQIALLFATSICLVIAMWRYKMPWRQFEDQIKKTLGGIAPTLFILLLVGMLSGSWMISGVVPTLIYYGIQIMSPQFFLFTTCIICAIVSVLSGSSWTTIATIGVALMGIGNALGISHAWMAGAIISGAYFGDKISPLSDTTILASSCTQTDLFRHIHYMLNTTVPTIGITLIIFLTAGLTTSHHDALHIAEYTDGLARTFHISLWTLAVPLITGVLIAKKVPSLITLFASAVSAGAVALLLQPHILTQIAAEHISGLGHTAALTHGLATTFFGATHIETHHTALNELVSTSGMAGMLNTIWLILTALCFGSAMIASRMLQSITNVLIRLIRTRFSLVTSTALTGVFLNITTGDQYMSIVLNADIHRDAYRLQGYETRLLSRTIEDGTTVTSVLVPWNTCGMTQATILNVPTLTYLPYCFFNFLSPVASIIVAAIGWKIRQAKQPKQ